ncbi:uncharacterized protein B0I36DRAFT_94873 [Microdochium trichocladiopsis]|uniref:Uncharacterized protein n=1 Tax=Microdochium trichocladiopsis TaxID=1682393 RepID=A0A9P8YC97_9PEZI|nr:uncharacterized protein B0I36DRAFT_94873 [Microdochium trichocladiopsis]KAH7035632.1 hypothetical protein B0I36DRAFT_94873 [Microdochium trichocladiopsis]
MVMYTRCSQVQELVCVNHVGAHVSVAPRQSVTHGIFAGHVMTSATATVAVWVPRQIAYVSEKSGVVDFSYPYYCIASTQ